MFEIVIRGIPLWLFQEYIEEIGGSAQADGWLHGGGWRWGNRRRVFERMFHLAEAGYFCIAPGSKDKQGVRRCGGRFSSSCRYRRYPSISRRISARPEFSSTSRPALRIWSSTSRRASRASVVRPAA